MVREEVGGGVLLAAHSTGGLVLPLWLDRLRRRSGGVAAAGIVGLVLNSPWFDLQGPSYLRNVGTAAIDVVGRLRPRALIPLPKTEPTAAACRATAGATTSIGSR